MKGKNTVHWRPYLPFNRARELNLPYVCRLAPDANGFTFEWFDKIDPDGEHVLVWGERGGETNRTPVTGSVMRVDGLMEEREHEFYLVASDGRESRRRLLRTRSLPEGTTVINYLHPDDTQYDFSGRYLCSPSIARTDSGRLVAGMDLFGPKMAQNLTLLFYSDDNGESWRYLCDVYPFYWSSLFSRGGRLYILGLTTEFGNMQIACSEDEGETWSAPTTLFYGSNLLCPYGGMNRAPMHLTEANGRLWGACEYGSWGYGSHIPAVFSMPVDAEPMNPESWTLSDLLPFEGAWREASGGVQGDTMEGNILRAPDGQLYNYLRWKCGEVLRMRVSVSDPEAPLTFVDIIQAPFANSMFRIFPYQNKWLAVANDPVVYRRRNLLSLFSSDDLLRFEKLRDLIDYRECDAEKYGFQYPSFLLEGDTLYLSVRSAFNQANSFHNSNYMLFMRVELEGTDGK